MDIPQTYLVYVALLRSTDEEFPNIPKWKLAIQRYMTGSDVVHVEIALPYTFGGYMSYTANTACGVTATHRKEFSKKSWLFKTIAVTKQEYEKIQRFLESKAKRPGNAGFNEWGANMVTCWPMSGYGMDYFCSELVAEALQMCSVVPAYASPAAHSPGDIDRILQTNSRVVQSINPNFHNAKLTV